MALECAHCGTRSPAGTTRCPQCLRGTGLVEVPDVAPPRTRRHRNSLVVIGSMAALCVLASGAWTWWHAKTSGHHRDAPVSLPDGCPPAFARGDDVGDFARVASSAHEGVARARAVMEAVHTALTSHGVHVVDDVDDVPPARTIAQIGRALIEPAGRVTLLDLARFEASALRTADTDADVAEQTVSLRAGEPTDPTAMLGRYAVIVGDSAVDLGANTVVPSREVRPTRLDEARVVAAMLAQSALAQVAVGGERAAGAVPLADESVRRWPEGTVPLATRSRVWRAVGASGGTHLAAQDVASALALRASAPLHLLRARMALLEGDEGAVASSARSAVALARDWGPAALAAALTGGADADAGGNACDALTVARDAWASDALLLCRHAPGSEAAIAPAAERLIRGTHDPMQLALGAAAGGRGATARVSSADRGELAAWLGAMGRGDLAAAVMGRGDAAVP